MTLSIFKSLIYDIAKKIFQFNSVRTLLAFWFLIITLVPLTVVSAMIYSRTVQTRKTAIFDKLEAIRDLKVNEVSNWLDGRIGDVRTIAADNEIRMLERIYKGSEEYRQKDIAIIADARVHLDRFVRNFNAFYEIFILNPNTGKIMVSTDERDEGENHSNAPFFEETLKKRELFIKDIYYSDAEHKPSMAFSIPVFGLGGGDNIIGVLVARINLDASLYDLLLNRTGMGKTGETIIVNRNLVALNELRWHQDAPLKLRIKAKSALEAVSEKTGIVETEDYRGEKVLAAYAYIPLTGWGFVAKQDIQEVYAPIYQLRSWTLLIGITTLFGVILTALLTARTISMPIEAMHKGSEIIGSGNMDYKFGTDRKDEIGQLSRTFDQMIENIKNVTASRDELNKEIAERRHLEKAVLEIEEREKRRIGHDLHDDLGQQLAGISFKSQCMENSLREKASPDAEAAARIKFLIDRAKEQVKHLSRGLSPMVEKGERGLMVAMEELVDNTEKIFNVPCVLKCDKPVLIHNETAVTHLYRIAQESVTNAVRHAGPRNIAIGLGRDDDNITLTIKDDGKGIAEVAGQKNGMGLQTMRYRAHMIGASLDISPDVHGGTQVTCFFNDKSEKAVKSPEEGKRLNDN
jgi:signal transduction histidine kinase